MGEVEEVVQLLVGAVGLDVHLDPDLVVAHGYRVIEIEKPADVDVSGELGRE